MRKLVFVFACFLLAVTLFTVHAQPAHSCGDMNGFSVVYAHVDNLGIAPQAAPGSELRFNCIAARDPAFSSQRFDSAWKAANYWFILFSQELGQSLQPLPAPSS
jgi:hypothetical protein